VQTDTIHNVGYSTNGK